MSSVGKLICAVAWTLAAFVQIVVVTRFPEKVVISGVDVSTASSAALLHGAALIGCGLALAVAAFIPKRWAWLLAIASALLYLAHWFPFGSVQSYGFVTVFKGKALIGWNPGLRLSFVTRDIILPTAFVTAIVLIVLGTRRSSQAGRA